MSSLLQKIKELVSSVNTKQDLITETSEIEVFNITSNINFIDNIDPNNYNSLSYTSLKYIEDSVNLFVSQIGDLTTTKQDKLTAGDNITIDENNVISSSSGGGSSSSIELFKFSMVRSNTAVALNNDDTLGFVNLDRETGGLTMTSNGGIITFGGSNVAGTYEIKYSLVLTNFQGTTNRILIRAYKNGLWIAEFGKLSGFLENGSLIVDISDGDTIEYKVTGLQTGSLSLATGLETETYDACVLTGIKLF
jgi:hypothetical protein